MRELCFPFQNGISIFPDQTTLIKHLSCSLCRAGGFPTGTHIPAVRIKPIAVIYSAYSSSSANRSQLLYDCLTPAIWWGAFIIGNAENGNSMTFQHLND